ncbi:hypothetical protein ACO2I3_01935 [Leptospira interrogans]
MTRRAALVAALRLLTGGYSDSQVLQSLEGISRRDLHDLLKFLHAHLVEPDAPYTIDPSLAHLRADLRAMKASPRKCRSTTLAEREKAWRAYLAEDPLPADENFVRAFDVPLGLVRLFRGARQTLERYSLTPPPDWRIAEAQAKALRAFEGVKRIRDKKNRRLAFKRSADGKSSFKDH